MRWFPVALFLFLFWLPNYLGWVESPVLDYGGMLFIAACFVLLYPGAGSRTSLKAPAGEREIQTATVTPLGVFLLFFATLTVLPWSAALEAAASGGFSTEVREESLKLAPIHVPVIVNLFRDALLPFLIIESRGNGQTGRWLLLLVAFAFFATFNLAKSFIIINTLAILMALVSSPVVLTVSFVVLLVPVLLVLAVLYGGQEADVQAFVLDFVIRRILTLTAELGVDVREMVAAHGYYWGGRLDRAFEYELYSFIRHSDLESGWANVYAMADAFGRGGLMGMALLLTTLILYLLFFWLIVRPLSPRYATYLWALFCIYVFMQGIFSFGLLISFFAGPAIVLAFQGALVRHQERSVA